MPDIVADVRQLSAILPITGIMIGAVLWLVGWQTHRFWVVLGFTVLGGIWGLQNAAALKSQPLVAAIGIGLAAGILGLTLVRLGAFVAGGYACLLLTHAALPTWDQPLISFLAGGLLGFFLFRYWTMALTSLAGVVVMGHAIFGAGGQARQNRRHSLERDQLQPAHHHLRFDGARRVPGPVHDGLDARLQQRRRQKR